MSDISILNLPVAVSISGSEYFPLVQGGTTKRAQTSQVANFAAGTGVQTANTVYAGPSSGAASVPAFRALVAADIPASIVTLGVGSTTISSGTTTRVLYDNAGTLGEYAISGTGSVAMTTSPTFVTPTLGVATATTLNGLTITSSTGTLTIPNGASLITAGAFSATLTFTALTNVTFPTTGTLATLAGSETFTNKSLTSPTITGTPTAASATWTSLGTVTTIDINGGTVDAAVIGGASAAAGTFTTLTANTSILPGSDGAVDIGSTSAAFNNLHLDTGATINIENGNWVATHTSGILTVGTGDLRVTTAGTNTASVVTVDGTQTLANKTLTAPVIGAATGTSAIVTGILTARSATATPAAASAVAGLTMGSSAIGIYWGTGSPNTALTAAKGSLYLRTDGSTTNDRIYINTDGVTAWTNITAAA